MKDMIYRSGKEAKREVLDSGDYRGFKFYAINVGNHPCGYVEVPESSWAHTVKSYDDERLDEINVHGGFSFCKGRLFLQDKDLFAKGQFLGWDYAHFGDYTKYDNFDSPELGTRRYTTEEIVAECKSVIDQIIAVPPKRQKTKKERAFEAIAKMRALLEAVAESECGVPKNKIDEAREAIDYFAIQAEETHK